MEFNEYNNNDLVESFFNIDDAHYPEKAEAIYRLLVQRKIVDDADDYRDAESGSRNSVGLVVEIIGRTIKHDSMRNELRRRKVAFYEKILRVRSRIEMTESGGITFDEKLAFEEITRCVVRFIKNKSIFNAVKVYLRGIYGLNEQESKVIVDNVLKGIFFVKHPESGAEPTVEQNPFGWYAYLEAQNDPDLYPSMFPHES